jgi:hypothetical protein
MNLFRSIKCCVYSQYINAFCLLATKQWIIFACWQNNVSNGKLMPMGPALRPMDGEEDEDWRPYQ